MIASAWRADPRYARTRRAMIRAYLTARRYRADAARQRARAAALPDAPIAAAVHAELAETYAAMARAIYDTVLDIRAPFAGRD